MEHQFQLRLVIVQVILGMTLIHTVSGLKIFDLSNTTGQIFHVTNFERDNSPLLSQFLDNLFEDTTQSYSTHIFVNPYELSLMAYDWDYFYKNTITRVLAGFNMNYILIGHKRTVEAKAWISEASIGSYIEPNHIMVRKDKYSTNVENSMEYLMTASMDMYLL